MIRNSVPITKLINTVKFSSVFTTVAQEELCAEGERGEKGKREGRGKRRGEGKGGEGVVVVKSVQV